MSFPFSFHIFVCFFFSFRCSNIVGNRKSLGVVLYVLVCGALPFDGPTIQSLRDRVLSGRFRIPFFMSTGINWWCEDTLNSEISKTLFPTLFWFADCESLIRKMLVLDPNRRYTIPQIKQHRWMLSELVDSMTFLSEKSNSFNRSSYAEPNEQVLRLMSGLGIDIQRTRNSLKVRLFRTNYLMNRMIMQANELVLWMCDKPLLSFHSLIIFLVIFFVYFLLI